MHRGRKDGTESSQVARNAHSRSVACHIGISLCRADQRAPPMIPAEKTALFNRWFAGEARSRIHATFSSIRVQGLAAAQASALAAPTLAVANHTAWWDPMVAIYLSNFVLAVDGYAMMDAKNLRKLPFFRRVGAFGVDIDDPADGARSLRYAAKLLTSPAHGAAQKLVWIFPQGSERPITEPCVLRPGSAEIARLAKGCKVQVMAIRYEFAQEEKPRLYLSFGSAMDPVRDPKLGLANQQSALRAELERIDAHLRGGDTASSFDILHQHTESAVGYAMTRMLAWWTRLPKTSLPP
jgi:1-acyl-sn-glycerol-3-phosphate acyltransferase